MKNYRYFAPGLLLSLFVFASCSKTEPSPPVQAAAAQPAAPALDAQPKQTEPPAPAPVQTPIPKAKAVNKTAVKPKPASPSTQLPPRANETPAQPVASASTSPATLQPPIAEPPLPPPAPTTREVTIPSGTMIPIRMIDSVDSTTDQVGRSFRASMDDNVVVDGETILRKGSNVDVKLTRVQSAGDFKGRSELELKLNRLSVGDKKYVVESNPFVASGAAQGTKTIKNTGIGAAIGAAIGAIAGGKKGAAIGATAGGGAGTAAAVITKDDVRIESETQVVFRLEEPLKVIVDLQSSRNAR